MYTILWWRRIYITIVTPSHQTTIFESFDKPVRALFELKDGCLGALR